MSSLFQDTRFGIRALRKNQGFAAVAVLVAATALVRGMESLLASVSSRNPLTFIARAIVLTLAALAASYIPTRRAMKWTRLALCDVNRSIV